MDPRVINICLIVGGVLWLCVSGGWFLFSVDTNSETDAIEIWFWPIWLTIRTIKGFFAKLWHVLFIEKF